MRSISLGAAFVIGVLLAGCGKKPVASAPRPPPPKQNLVVLLSQDNGVDARIVVTNTAGSQELALAYAAVRLEGPNTAPSPFSMDPAEARRIFGQVLDTLPLAQWSVALYFDFNSLNLTPESRALLPEIAQMILSRRSTDVSLTGHTDTTGTRQVNYQFGLDRAAEVKEFLRTLGVDPANLFLSSHGDADLLVKTGPNMNEPRNRRVEVIVR
jgi:outer membrane protein OmpA-like peptidoglycan-associated protein